VLNENFIGIPNLVDLSFLDDDIFQNFLYINLPQHAFDSSIQKSHLVPYLKVFDPNPQSPTPIPMPTYSPNLNPHPAFKSSFPSLPILLQ
jgi:hypothetical protein